VDRKAVAAKEARHFLLPFCCYQHLVEILPSRNSERA
jgi:hypothetical protein